MKKSLIIGCLLQLGIPTVADARPRRKAKLQKPAAEATTPAPAAAPTPAAPPAAAPPATTTGTAKPAASAAPTTSGSSGSSATTPPSAAPAAASTAPAAASAAPAAASDTATTEQPGGLPTQTGPVNPWDQNATPAGKAKAKLLVAQGNQHLTDGLMEKAAIAYRDASKEWDHPAIWYNLALALVSLDQPVEMYEALLKAQRWQDHQPAPLDDEKYRKIKDYLPLVEKQIATVEISCQKEGAQVSLNGKQLFVVEKGKPNKYVGKVRVGKHTFVAEKPGFATPVDAPFIGPGETFRVELRLFTADELTRYKRRWDRTWVPYAVIGGGVLAGLVGGGLQLAARSDFDDYDQAVARCRETRCVAEEQQLLDMQDRGESKRTMGIVGYSIAGAAVLTGAALLYLNRRQAYLISTDQYRMEELAKAKRQSVTFAPMVAPSSAGAMVLGEF